jgi:hypothetical protein
MSRTQKARRGDGYGAVARRGVWMGVLVAACSGGSNHPQNIGDMTGRGGATGAGGGAGSRGIGGSGASTDGGGDSGAVIGAPVVKVTSPTPLDAPTAGPVLVGDTVAALCRATRSASAGSVAVDPSTVTIAVLDATDHVVKELPGTPTGNANEYTASFVVTTIDNGVIRFQCHASDTSTPAKTGADEISTYVDHGPEVTVSTPAPDSAYPLTGAVPFAFKVTPAPLAPGDPSADVTSVTLSVNGVMIPVTRDPSDPRGYKLAVDFNDTSLFPQPPAGFVPVEIRAKDSRTPSPGERVNSYRFALDGAGPVITLTKPKNQDIIGGKVTMEFTVVDPLAGVDAKTVSVELNQVAKFFAPTDTNWTANKSNYTYTFDSANIAGSKVQVTVNITASDLAGNKSAGESVVLYLDNFPPIVDLDPANVRQLRKMGNDFQCSESFDPLGSRAANDGDLVAPFTVFRALVWEQTNSIAGQSVLYFAGADPSSVYLYLQPDSSTPLLIDTDHDGVCDALDTSPGGTPLPNLRLNPVPPTGTAFFDPNADTAAAPPITPNTPNACALGNDQMRPARLCVQNASDLTEVIRHNSATVEPVVYAIGGLMGLECTGTGWELSSQLAGATQKEGWFCLAAVAKDKVGNSAISPPLRVCYDDGVGTSPSCTTPGDARPSCTDGCRAPARFTPSFLAAPP